MKFQLSLAPTELASFEKETSVISSYEHRVLSDACRTGTPARRCPRRARVPVLQVTAQSDALSYTFLLPMKFQLSPAPATLPHSRKETPVGGRGGGLQAAVLRAERLESGRLRPGDRTHVRQPQEPMMFQLRSNAIVGWWAAGSSLSKLQVYWLDSSDCAWVRVTDSSGTLPEARRGNRYPGTRESQKISVLQGLVM